MTQVQFVIFDAFWRSTLNAGANEFTYPVRNFSGAGSTPRRAYIIGGSYTLRPVGTRKIGVSMTMKVRDA